MDLSGPHRSSPALTGRQRPSGGALERQLRPISDDLDARLIPDCGHIIPLDRPRELLDHLAPFLASLGG